MCGRYATTRSALDLAAFFDAEDETEGGLVPDFNVAPTDPVPVVRATSAGRVLHIARWGLVPHWRKDNRGAAKMINARAETVATTSAYAASFRNRRAILPADGWYEWRPKPGGGKQAFYLTSTDGRPLAFAGLTARSAAGVLTCAVITTGALGQLADIHDRMPLLLPADRFASWLAGNEESTKLLRPPPADLLAAIEVRPVGPAVGDVRNDGPQLITKVSISDDARWAGPPSVEPVDLTLF
jgi:putative SOS response-associated peptidase YedK